MTGKERGQHNGFRGKPENWRESLEVVLREIPQAVHLLWDTHRILALGMILGMIISGVIPAALAYMGKLLVDQVLIAKDSGQDTELLILLVVITAMLELINNTAKYLGIFSQSLLQRLLNKRVSLMILGKVSSLDLSYFETPRFLDVLQRAANELDTRTVQITSGLVTLTRDFVACISLFLLLIRFRTDMVILLLLLSLPSLAIQLIYGRQTYGIAWSRSPKMRMMSYIQSLMTSPWGVKEIKVFGLSELLLSRFKKLFKEFYYEDRNIIQKRNSSLLGSSWVSTIVYYSAFGVVIFQATAGQITIGDLTMFTIVFFQLQARIAGITTAISHIFEQGLYLHNVAELMLLKSLIPNKGSTLLTPSFEKNIMLENLSFAYPGTEKEVLHNINLIIPAGKVYALVGSNGAGKSTLMKLLVRLYDPSGGRITIDGVDIREYPAEEWQRNISILFQGFAKYNLTVQDNVGFGCIEALEDIDRISIAAHKSGADKIISKLPDLYDTVLGTKFYRGHQLSGGEWQKIALARSLIRDSRLIILDEPTSSMDAESEAKFIEDFREIFRDKTAIVISHRLALAGLADSIIVINNGQIEAQGTHRELLAECDLYKKMFEVQAQKYSNLAVDYGEEGVASYRPKNN